MRTTSLLLTAVLLATVALGALPAAGQATPTSPPTEAALTGVTDVVTGGYHSCALLTNGQVRCWGENDAGQLGTGAVSPTELRPQVVRNAVGTGPLTGVVALALGEYHTCALLASREARCWGAGGNGQLGDGRRESSALPVAVRRVTGPQRLVDVAQISAGETTSCAVLGSGQVRCWGLNADGILGAGSSAPYQARPVPVRAVTGAGVLTGVTQVSVGQTSACARLADGQARCWGHNALGQLGDGTDDVRMRPVVVRNAAGTGPLIRVRRIDLGKYHTCAVMTDATARCWGANDDGELGIGTVDGSLLPKTVADPTGTSRLTGVATLDAAVDHSCARLTNGQARCWGDNGYGQAGLDYFGGDLLVPTPVKAPGGVGELGGVTRLHTSAWTVCARVQSGRALCWGAGDDGQLGQPALGDEDLPVPVEV